MCSSLGYQSNCIHMYIYRETHLSEENESVLPRVEIGVCEEQLADVLDNLWQRRNVAQSIATRSQVNTHTPTPTHMQNKSTHRPPPPESQTTTQIDTHRDTHVAQSGHKIAEGESGEPLPT